MADEQARVYYERYRKLLEDRESWIPWWESIRDQMLPRSGMFDDYGDRPNQDVDRHRMMLDGTATRALRVLAAGMQGGLTSPARPWFRLGLYDEELEHYKPVKVWLEDVEERMYSRFARSNFYNAVHRIYKEEAGYGQGALIIEEDPMETLRFITLTCGEYCFAESARGVVDTIYRLIWMQARQMKQKFGDNLPSDVRKALEKSGEGQYEWFKVLHCLQPRKEYDPRKADNLNMPFESVYLAYPQEAENEKIIKASGYEEQPIACPRWDTVSGEAYGRSPGHDVIGDVGMLNKMSEDLWEVIEKLHRPPLVAPSSMKGMVSHLAGYITYGEESANTAVKALYEIRADAVRAIVEARNDTRLQIREGLYNDLFLMLVEPRPNMTATEVVERHEEKLLMLGPVIERQFHELLNPTIDRSFAVMWRKGEIPPPPKVLQEMMKKDPSLSSLKVEYISLLAQAQKLVTTQSIRSVSDYVASLGQFDPSAWDKFNIDKAIEEFGDATGAPPEIIRTNEEAQKIREVRAKEMQQKAAIEKEAAMAQTAKTMSETDTEEQNALTDLQGSMEAI
jgi:hypothetical protein